MSYDPQIPQPNDDMGQVSQPGLLTNFGQLNTVFDQNHETFNAASNRGKHKFVQFPVQGSDPEAATTEIVLFAKDGTNIAQPELHSVSNLSGTQTVSQLTQKGELYLGAIPAAAVNFTGTPTIQNSYNILPGGGVALDGGAGLYKITFNSPITDRNGAQTNLYLWTVSGFDSSSNPVIGSVRNVAYNSAVDSTFIRVQFLNQNATPVTNLLGASVIIWKIQ